MAGISLNPSGCCCTAATATIIGSVQSCGTNIPTGMVVEAHDSTSGGTLLGTGTVAAGTGVYTITASGVVAGNSIVIVPVCGPKLTAQTKTLTYTAGSPSSTQWSPGQTTSGVAFSFVADSNYVCVGGCAYPVKKTLSITDANGTFNLTWSSGVSWLGSKTVSVTCITAAGCSGFTCGLTTGTGNVTYRSQLSLASGSASYSFTFCAVFDPGTSANKLKAGDGASCGTAPCCTVSQLTSQDSAFVMNCPDRTSTWTHSGSVSCTICPAPGAYLVTEI